MMPKSPRQALVLQPPQPTSIPRTPVEITNTKVLDEALKNFYQGLKKPMLITAPSTLGANNLSPLCPRCKIQSFPWKSGKLKWREIEDGAHNCKCPICQFLLDWLPINNMSKVFTVKLSKEQKAPDLKRAVLKVGRLDKLMDKIIAAGASLEDRSTGSDAAFQMVAAWLSTCIKDHRRCASVVPPLPTRVIDVGPPDGSLLPRIHVPQNEKGLYFTLSYRWDQDSAKDFRTTAFNFNLYATAIEPSTLPQIMQDAILITRKLGVKYLWIDALCIIQDSDSDWQKEAKQMATIYSRSMLTISAAADAQDDHKGCFRPRKRLQTRPFDTRSPWPDGSAKYIFADRRFTQDGARPQSILDTRAWILQEQLLSPRILSYSNEELYWDCLCSNASESFPCGIPGFYDIGLNLGDTRIFKDAILANEQRKLDHARFYYSWHRVVETYSERDLTRETDKLAAILGVAKEASIAFEDEFLVGLWRKQLWMDLLWWAKDPETSARPKTFSAPSWSWASLVAPISYDLRAYQSAGDLTQAVEILHAEAESDQTLPTLSGKIILRGKLVKLTYQASQSSLPTSETDSKVDTRPAAGPVYLPSWKEDIRDTDSDAIMCLILAISDRYVYGIGILPMKGGNGNYTRAGMVDWRAPGSHFGWDESLKNWKDEKSLESITLF